MPPTQAVRAMFCYETKAVQYREFDEKFYWDEMWSFLFFTPEGDPSLFVVPGMKVRVEGTCLATNDGTVAVVQERLVLQ